MPAQSLLQACRAAGAYTDCYVTDVDAVVTQQAFVEAFYTTALFKVERCLLKLMVARPSTDAEAAKLARGQVELFAAWRVEARSESQLLLADMSGRTKSWLMAAPVSHEASPGQTPQTRLYFGSAVVPASAAGNSGLRMGFVFHSLLGFHRLYSRLLLGVARSRVLRAQTSRSA
ncbi:MAG: hypothetical protein ABIR94_15465 [Rubrivivax sp.]